MTERKKRPPRDVGFEKRSKQYFEINDEVKIAEYLLFYELRYRNYKYFTDLVRIFFISMRLYKLKNEVGYPVATTEIYHSILCFIAEKDPEVLYSVNLPNQRNVITKLIRSIGGFNKITEGSALRPHFKQTTYYFISRQGYENIKQLTKEFLDDPKNSEHVQQVKELMAIPALHYFPKVIKGQS